ncbi:L-lactate dehydrogenase [Paenibacillus mucilaginosus]|uniref:L-lactate dehydrogenase n=2 Tax=Paenibacillus mucilaginosus TaxID=61624 RepID=I0BCT1_9BACL|nr:L-lactate dehydrogenase [Paenibacillus mucilaginosus]AEI42219.1 Ldh [Paenibacillus mucilaginosus KNP414]AFH60178.1 lactate dehydrogenase [Paenibacillus mucilaginosus K02]MCG7214184.1 L-lactate dehydrogenase [Paenibacillus mucilaginosus]WDM28701.1 L-lactate dehydrogenase [Paenibacillus mucilaginosus]
MNRTPFSKKTRIVVIGTGAVGSTTAYTLLLRGRMDELVLIDANAEKAKGDALDMNHGMPFLGNTDVWAGTYEDCRDADIVIITAGAAQKPGESRIDLLKRNAAILESITDEVLKYNKDGILLVASNPVDVMSYLTWRKSGWPARRVIGSGTLLDSARFRYLIGQELQVDPRSVHAHIVGEHGDSELPLWSLSNIAGGQLSLSEEKKAEIFANTRDAAYQIIEAKGATYYAIALALDRICTAILRSEAAVLNVSTLLKDYHGISDVYLGVPCVVDRTGVREVLGLQITEEERQRLQASADKLKGVIASIGL